MLASRLASGLSTGLGGNRRGREVIGTVVLVVVVFAGPLLSLGLGLISGAGDIGAQLGQAATILAWTPLGAAWAVPGDIASGAIGLALVRLLIALATPVVLWFAWRGALIRATVSPARHTARTVRPGALGLFGIMPTGGVGATWARSLTGWLRDPRYLRQLIVAPLFPVLFVFVGGTQSVMFTASTVMVAFVLCIGGYTDVSYDGTAYSSVLSAGISGRADRWGRVLGAGSLGVPLLLVLAVVTAAVSGHWEQLPAVLGASLALVLAGYGVTAVSSALIATPVAAPGDSPFKTVPGQTFVSGLMVFVVMGACMVLAAPAIVLAIVSTVSGNVALGWMALAVGVLFGAAVVFVGVFVGGRTIERTGPDLLLKIKAFPVT